MSNSNPNVGTMRLQSDMRQIAALLLITGMCSIFQPLGDIAAFITPGNTSTTGIPFSALMGSLCLVVIGLLAVFVGYNQLVHEMSSKYITAFLILFVQTAYIIYLTGMVDIGKAAKAGAGFIPATYGPSAGDVRFVGAMGILSIVAYGFTFVGSIAFFAFALYAYQAGHPQDRNGAYYKGRMLFYTGMLMVAGTSQFVLGSFVNSKFGGGSLDKGTIGVAVYVVNFPGMNIFVGLLQMINAVWGLARSYDIGVFGTNDVSFQASMFLGFFVQLLLQVIVQIGYVPGDTLSAAAPKVFGLMVGLNLMPAYLDYKARTVPDDMPMEYYDSEKMSVASIDNMQQLKEDSAEEQA
jgi:hypothetical protein